MAVIHYYLTAKAAKTAKDYVRLALRPLSVVFYKNFISTASGTERHNILIHTHRIPI